MTTMLVCPTGKSVKLAIAVNWLSSPFAKNIPLSPSGKSSLQARPSHPARGAYRDRHERGMGCGGRGSVLRATWLQGGLAKGL